MGFSRDILEAARRYSPAFLAAMQHVLEAEGGWSDNPKDPGGATYVGITLKLLRAWRNNPATTKADLRAIDPMEVAEIYHTLFWRNVKGDEMPAGVSLLLFDAAVNSGVKNAGLALQRAINRYAPFEIREDGVLGPKTLSAVTALEPMQLAQEFGSRRMFYYGLLIKLFQTFGLGWSRRLMAGVQAATIAIAAANLVKERLSSDKDPQA